MDLIAALEQTLAHTQRVVAGVRPDQLDNPTPCSQWNLGALLSHTMGVVHNIGVAVATGSPAGTPNEVALGPDLGAQFSQIASTTLAAWKAAGLEGDTNIGAGPMPRAAALGINLLDTATHSWDIATASGQSAELDPELAQLVLGISRNVISDEVRKLAGFDAASTVGADATATQQLAAFLGRKP